MGNYIRIFVDEHQTTWYQFVRSAAHAYNNTPHSSTGLAPMEVLFGFLSEIPTNLKRKPEPLYNIDDYCDELKFKLRTLYGIAHRNIQNKNEQAKRSYDKNCNISNINVGDKILKIAKNRNSKLSNKYQGPFEVLKINNDVNITIKNGHREERIHKNLVKLYKE